MNYRQKCKTNGKWAFVKYKGDGAIYAACQNCGYTYASYQEDKNRKILPKKPHKFCPNCGLKMSLFNEMEVYKIDRYIWD